MLNIDPRKAIELLKFDQYSYKYFIECLNDPKRNAIVYATDNEPRSLIYIEKPPYYRESCDTVYDVQLYVASVDDIDKFLERLPTDGNSFIFMYDKELPPIVASKIKVKPEGIRYHFYSSKDKYNNEYSEEVIELSEEHDPLIMATESPRVHDTWSIYRDFKDEGYDAYGIIKGNKLLSFCCIGPDSAKSVGTPLREVGYIYTEKEYRRRGLGQTLLRTVIKKLASKGECLYYSADEDNIASRNTAKAAGLLECGCSYACYTY